MKRATGDVPAAPVNQTEKLSKRLTFQRVSRAPLVAFDVEKAGIGFEECSEPGPRKADLLEDHG